MLEGNKVRLVILLIKTIPARWFRKGTVWRDTDGSKSETIRITGRCRPGVALGIGVGRNAL
jgi:hypothetical protein